MTVGLMPEAGTIVQSTVSPSAFQMFQRLGTWAPGAVWRMVWRGFFFPGKSAYGVAG